MDHGAIELRAPGGAIAERNEEINRRRLAHGGARSGGQLRVTDPAALMRLMAEMKAKAEQQRAVEEAREEERRQREGAAYKTPEQRAEEARAARAAAAAEAGVRLDGEEARVLEKRFDPARDYYQLLGIARGASAAEVRKAYKRLVLLHHPDKYRGADPEQQEAIADKFKLVVEAFDVLSDEEQRAVYDKCRDYMVANPGKGLPALSPEEAARMRSGIAELSRLRRQGVKSTKHAPLEREVFVSLEKLNAGCTKTVAVERRRVAPDGSEFASVKNVHLVIRRGSREGDRHVFEGDGCESVDTMPGDLVLTLRQKPHPVYRRSGAKDLELFAQALGPGEVVFAVEVPTIHGKRLLLTGSALREAAANGGSGGMWQAVLPGQGLFDAAEPWEQLAGKLTVQLRYPACMLAEASIACCLKPQPVHLLGSADDKVAAALAAGSVAGMLNHRREAEEMAAEAAGKGSSCCYREGPSSSSCSSGGSGGSLPASGGSSRSSSRRPSDGGSSADSGSGMHGSKSSSTSSGGCRGRRLSAACLVVDMRSDPGEPSCHPCQPSCPPSADGRQPCSPAAAATLRALHKQVPGLRSSVAVSSCLLDEDWERLWGADVLVLDLVPELQQGKLAAAGMDAPPAGTKVVPVSKAAEPAQAQQERRLAAAAARLAEAGLLELVWQRFWSGCLVVGVGQACALLGRSSIGSAVAAAAESAGTLDGAGAGPAAPAAAGVPAVPAVLPWFLVRAGGGPAGWASLQAALAASEEASSTSLPPQPSQKQRTPLVGVGVMASGCWVVHPYSGRAELLVAPCRDVLVATAAWNAAPANDPARLGLSEVEDEDWGFFCELAAGSS